MRAGLVLPMLTRKRAPHKRMAVRTSSATTDSQPMEGFILTVNQVCHLKPGEKVSRRLDRRHSGSGGCNAASS